MAGDNMNLLRLRQINCGKQERSTALLSRWHKHTDITCVQEPNVGQLRNLRKVGKLYTCETHKLPRAAIFIHNNIDATKLLKHSNRDLTSILLEKQKTVIASIYLDKNYPVWPSSLDQLVTYCRRKNFKLLMGLDANAHSSTWGNKYNDNRGYIIEQICVRNNLTICNVGNEFTYDDSIFRKTKVRKSIPDITISNVPNLISDWEVSDEPSLSDHKIIKYNIKNISRKPDIQMRNFKNTNWELIAKDISHIVPENLPQYWSEYTLENACQQLTQALKDSLDVHAPYKPPSKRYEYWWNSTCSESKRKSLKAERIAKKRRTEQLRKEARKALREYQRICWKAKSESWKKFISEIDSIPAAAKVTKIMRSLQEKDTELGLVKDNDGNLAETKQESLELMMNEHFPNCTFIEKPEDSAEPDKLRFVPQRTYEWITRDRFRLAVLSFNPGKAPGLDEWRAEILQHLDDTTIDYIIELFTASISLHYVPLDWRRTNVKFLSKAGKTDYSARNSFRPISLMSVLCKTLERLAFWQIEETALSTKPFHDSQYAYRKGVGCENALSAIVNSIEKATHKGEYCLIVNTDIAGAFNHASHKSIMEAMDKRGIDKDITAWYNYFLKNRTCEAEIGDTKAVVTTEEGIPQGGITSGMIWSLIYEPQLEEFDKPAHTRIEVKAFADDGTLKVSGKNIKDVYKVMQKALNIAQAWATECGLKYCPAKCNAMLFTTKRKKINVPKLQLNGQQIPQVKTAKILGVIFDTKLSWIPHLNQKIDKCKAILMKIKPILNRHWSPNPIYNRWIYTSVIIPILTYGSVIWERVSENKNIQKKLEKLQRLGLTGIANARRSTPTAALEHIYNVMPLHLQIKQKAQETFLRLGELKTDEWNYPRIKKQGHLQRLRASLPNLRQDDTMIPRPNRNRSYKVVIDYALKDTPETEGILIFSDGSKSKENTGSGVLYEDEEYGERLPDRSIFQAEIRAIQLACERILHNDVQQHKITIHVDSQAALKALRAPYVKSKLAGETVELLNLIGHFNDLTLRWIKAHNPDNEEPTGNDIADEIAKQAAKSTNWTSATIYQPRSEMINYIRNYTRERWETEWRNRTDCRQTKAFIEKPQPQIWRDLKTHGSETICRVIKFLSGHGHMNRHRTVVKYSITKAEADTHEEAQCRLCQEHEETPIHLITECEALADERLNIFSHTEILAWYRDKPPDWSPALLDFINLQTVRDLDTQPTELT